MISLRNMGGSALFVALLFSAKGSQAQFPPISPNGFQSPASEHCADSVSCFWWRWKLSFSRTFNRNAKKWATDRTLITNARLVFAPRRDTIMVLDTPSGQGHVAAVMDVRSTNASGLSAYIQVYHSAFPTSPAFGSSPHYQWFEMNRAGDKVRPVSNTGQVGTWLPVLGFLNRF